MERIAFDLGMVLVGAAILSYVAVLFKQPIIMAYILCGVLMGPWGFGIIHHIGFIENISRLGITLLLFLAGLCLHPQKLIGLFKKTSVIAFTNCSISFVAAFLCSLLCRFSLTDSVWIGLAMMFSSTILAVKLMPTTTLHQQRMGAACIAILILEDLLAVMVLVLLRGMSAPQASLMSFPLLLLKVVLLIGALFLFEHYVLRKVMARVEFFHEALFILSLAWCLGVAIIAQRIGLLYEVGAFFAGVVLARHKISFFISEKLKPLRDFFLVLFFFSLGAQFDLSMIKDVIGAAALLAVVFVVMKPLVFRKAFLWTGEKEPFAREIGFRLGQLSEFSLLIALLALELGHISARSAQVIQLATILTFILSSYIVVYKFPTPIGTSAKLIRD